MVTPPPHRDVRRGGTSRAEDQGARPSLRHLQIGTGLVHLQTCHRGQWLFQAEVTPHGHETIRKMVI